MADEIGVSPSAYGNYENNYSQPNYELLEGITKILGVNAQDLLFSDLQANKEDTAHSISDRVDGLERNKQSLSPAEVMQELESLRKDINEIKARLDKKK